MSAKVENAGITGSSRTNEVRRVMGAKFMILVGGSVAGCDSAVVAPEAPVVVAIAASPSSMILHRSGATVQLTAVAMDAKGRPIDDVNISWTSLRPDVATVDLSGVVTAVDGGTARVVAASGAAADTAEIIVREYAVPATIASDCSLEVTGALHAWFASVPDGSTLMFGRDACYNIDAGLIVIDRVGLTFDGNGSTFRVFSEGDPNRSNWTIRAGRDITLRNMIARGANPNAGTGNAAYVTRLEWQHAYRFQGTQTGTLEHVQAYDVYGDFVEAEPDWTRVADWPGEPARNITVRHSRFERNGRMGIALTHVDGFVLEDSYIGEVRWSAIDLELDDPRAIGRNVRIERNSFGRARHGIFTNFGQGMSTSIGNVVFSHNVMEVGSVSCVPPVWAGTPGEGVYWTGYRFEGNTLRTYGNAFEMTRTRDVTIRGNTVHLVPGGGCGRDEMARVKDSHGGTVTGNNVTGAWSNYMAMRADPLTTGFVETGNTVQ
jgi:hypothetical protein